MMLLKAISDGVHPVNMIVLREGKEIKLNPVFPDDKGLIGLGLASKQTLVSTKTPVAMVKESNKYLWDNTATMMYSLGQLFTEIFQ